MSERTTFEWGWFDLVKTVYAKKKMRDRASDSKSEGVKVGRKMFEQFLLENKTITPLTQKPKVLSSV